ncbi:Cell division protein FtsA [Sinobacterium norvegicum]|uniref:Cell division protein FtsA n=1 Tax=Sinobacterium norvegicum TaxID=1641715 RepID=A0ABM9AC11_9GAMM|nr:ethanolamine utilization protein EutJ [Sinobacterium norvegicum]CAH0990437.1 Cell division protein FtsA [Sinobacterium norvegicum]
MEAINRRLMRAHTIVNDCSPFHCDGDYTVGVDLGTADIVTMVVDPSGWPIACFLDWASVVKDGVVVDYYNACKLVRQQLDKVEKKLNISVEVVNTSFPPGTDARISTNVIESAGVMIGEVRDEPSSVAELLNVSAGAVVDIGGGTTGTAIIKNHTITHSFDEPTGGTHMSLTIAGNRHVSFDEAERLKKSSKNAQLMPIVKPVIEKFADIITQHVSDHDIDEIYLTGGTCCFPEIDRVFAEVMDDKNIILPDFPLYLTPLAIACSGLSHTSMLQPYADETSSNVGVNGVA